MKIKRYKQSIFVITLILLSGILQAQVVNSDSEFNSAITNASAITLNIDTSIYAAPYDIPKFQAALAQCKLQAPTSSTAATQAQLVAGYQSNWFYVADTNKIAFTQSGASKRTELRFLANWNVNNANRTAHANLKIVSQSCDQVTLIQIHDDGAAGGPNKPLLRIYKHKAKSPVNHLWAAYKTDAGGSATQHVDLGPDPTDYFNCDVSITNGNMIISIDGVEKVNVDVSYWTFPSYWKAGVYLQDDGEATAFFNELEWPDATPLTTSVGQGSVRLNPEFALGRNYPNPFNPQTTIEYQLSRAANVTLEIFDIGGRKLNTLVRDYKPVGRYKVTWNGKDSMRKTVASGVYLYRILVTSHSETFTQSRKMFLLK